MGCRVALGDVCSFYRGASVPRTRMYDKGAYLYIHYGDLYKGFDLHIDVEDPAKPIPYICLLYTSGSLIYEPSELSFFGQMLAQFKEY